MYLIDISELSGAEWEEDSLQGASYHQENPRSPTINCHLVPQGSKCVLRQERHLSGVQERLPRDQDHEELDDEMESEKTFFFFIFTAASTSLPSLPSLTEL